MTYNQYKDRVLYISKKYGLSHISSNLSMYPIFEQIYNNKKPDDLVICDNAHCGLGHLVVKEAIAEEGYALGMGAKFDAEELVKKYGIHCDREAGCDASGGSLGHTGIALGYAIADRTRKVYLIVSDGSVCEGSFYEMLRIAKLLNITNLEIHANFNGYTATTAIDLDYWEQFIKGFDFPITFHRTNNGAPEFSGVAGHYVVL